MVWSCNAWKNEVDRKLEGDKNGGMREEGIRTEGKGMGKRKREGEGKGWKKGRGGLEDEGRGWGCRKKGGEGKGWGMRDVGSGSGMGIGGNRAEVRNPCTWKGKSGGGF